MKRLNWGALLETLVTYGSLGGLVAANDFYFGGQGWPAVAAWGAALAISNAVRK